jgi:hypothetical protein
VGDNGSQAKQKFGDSVDSNLVAGDCDARLRRSIANKKREGSKYPGNIAWFLTDFLHWTRTDKLADSETKLGNALLIVDGAYSSLRVGRALFEGLMVPCFRRAPSMTQFHPGLRFVSTIACVQSLVG